VRKHKEKFYLSQGNCAEKKTVFWGEDGSEENFFREQSFSFSHFLNKSSRFFSKYTTILQRIKTRPLNREFILNLWGHKAEDCHTFLVEDSQQKSSILQRVYELSAEYKKIKIHADDICLIIDELFTNLVYNAPNTGNNISRKETPEKLNSYLKLAPKYSQIFLSISENSLIIGAEDYFGSLSLKKLLHKMKLSFSGQSEDHFSDLSGGAGLGMRLIYDRCDGFILRINPKKYGMICLIIDITKRKNIKKVSSSFIVDQEEKDNE